MPMEPAARTIPSLAIAGAAVALIAAAVVAVRGMDDVWEVSPFRDQQPFRVYTSTHKYAGKFDLAGFAEYMGGTLVMLLAYGIAWSVWPGDHLRHLQILNVVETGGLNFGGGFAQYPQYPIPTAYHDSHCLASRTVRAIWWPTVGSFLLGWACKVQVATLDNFSLLLVFLDWLPNFYGAPHVFQRPTHNLRLLLVSISSPASRSRGWSVVMGLFYLATGLPKCWPAFYRYWLWFGIYPSSTLSLFPPELFFARGADGGLHPTTFAQLFGFAGGVMETTLAVLHLLPYSTAALRRLRCLLGIATHSTIIAGRFDNGLSGWNMSWLLQNLAHSLASRNEGPTAAKVSPLSKAVLMAEAALVALFFCGHGSYHSGMSHHTGNFRMQWLVLHGDSAWHKLSNLLATQGRPEPCHTEFVTCVHNWGRGTHYPTASFEAFVYALAGGTAVQDVLSASVLSGNGSRAVFLGFASGWSVWDDAFYARWAANAVLEAVDWQPGECEYVELDRQKPWLRRRWVSVWDVSRAANGTEEAWSLLDGALGGPVVGRLVQRWPIRVRRPFVGM